MARNFFILVCLWVLLAGCATTPVVMQEGALPPSPLSELIAHADNYKGQTVVLGGYVLEVENQQHQTRILAVGVPVDSRQRPKSRDLSEGRLEVICDGFVDPEVYQKDRAITVNGEILGSSANSAEAPYPYLRIKMRDMHLWPEKELYDARHSLGYDPFYPWGYWSYPFWGYNYYWNYPFYRVYPYYRYPYYRYPPVKPHRTEPKQKQETNP